jgi:NAD(P)-dependent dehydrogenase (short-subunit alcohol dehydrogenase family)
VVVMDIDCAQTEKTVGWITDAGGTAVGICADVTCTDDAQAAVNLAIDTFGALHVLVNNAARFTSMKTVEEMALEEWNAALAVNLTGAFLMSKYALPAMRAAGGGSIIHVASQLGHVVKRGRSDYCTTKGGLLQLARSMAADHAVDNIRVNTLSPGPVATERVFETYGGAEAAEKRSGSLTLLNRLGRPEEIASAAVFLACDESSFMTGDDMLVDGGYNAV